MLTLEYRVLRKLCKSRSISHTDLMRSVRKTHLYDIDAVLKGLRDVGWISGTLTAGSSVSVTPTGRLEYLRAKQERLSRFMDSLRYIITTLIAAAAAFFAGAALFANK